MKPSIRLRLLKWLILPLISINLLGAGLAYWLAWIPAQIAFDQSLADSAWALIPRLRVAGQRVEIDLPRSAEQVLRVDHFDAIFFTVRDAAGHTIAGDGDFPPLRQPERLNDPLAYNGTMRGEAIRIIALKTMVGNKTVLIGSAETLRKRRLIRSEILTGLFILEAAGTLLLVALIWIAVGKGLRPLRRMQTELDRRTPEDFSPLPDQGLQQELVPVTRALNALLERVQTAARARQDFLADVAHQLRTPLAGLRAQLEWLQQHRLHDPEAARSAELMLSSLERMTRQSNQLLALARAEPAQYQKTQLEPTRLDKLVEESIQHFVREADKKRIDLGFHLHPTLVSGDRFLLRDLIDNLIDNALRYSTAGSSVTVACRQDAQGGLLTVEDEGPGIPPHARQTIFNRFYRANEKTAGSGLGLAIVRDIAEDHDATIDIASGKDDRGTLFAIRFPAIASGTRSAASAG